jgi:hypothetical protein
VLEKLCAPSRVARVAPAEPPVIKFVSLERVRSGSRIPEISQPTPVINET